MNLFKNSYTIDKQLKKTKAIILYSNPDNITEKYRKLFMTALPIAGFKL
jgi:hypothetical protein